MMLWSLPIGPVWCTQSIVLTVKGGSALSRWYFKLCFVFFGEKHAAFKWKDAISGFTVSPGSAEALVRWGGKIKYILIAYFVCNIRAKNCRNRTVYVKSIASCKGGTFLRHGVVTPRQRPHGVIEHFQATITNVIRHRWTFYEMSA